MFLENRKNGVRFMTSDRLQTVHGFAGRLGGVSTGIYDSLNLRVHCDDDRENLRENYRRFFDALGMPPAAAVTHQVHSTVVRTVTESDIHTLFTPVPYDADGLITAVPDLPLVIYSADCLPILLWDGENRAVGAVHAGWRGTVQDIVGTAVRSMAAEFGCDPENIRAAIGPGIGVCCFETGPEVPEAVHRALGKRAEETIRMENGRPHVDLKLVNSLLLQKAGLCPENIDISHECTMCSHEYYWSHRYTKGQRGVQGSAVMRVCRS